MTAHQHHACDRREFMRRSALTCAAFALPLGAARRADAAPPTGSTDPVLVTIFLRGAADGLNLVVPIGERARYDALRPTIAIPSGELISVSNRFALHPSLRPFKALYDADRLAVLHAVGSPHGTRSHFEAQDYMERAAPGSLGGAGWLNATLAALGGAAGPLQGVGFGTSLLSLQGDAATFVTDSLDAAGGVTGRRRTALEAMFAPVRNVLGKRARGAFSALDQLATVNRTTSVTYPGGALANGLKDAAALIKSGLPVRVMALDSTGWDTHSDETRRLAGCATELSGSLNAFWKDLGAAERDRTVVLVMTEFGRTAAENGSKGTDHGHGSAMFALGGRLRGGRVVTRWPGIGPSDLNQGRDLKVTTDFRDVFAEVLDKHMGLAPAQQAPIFPGHTVNPTNYPGLF